VEDQSVLSWYQAAVPDRKACALFDFAAEVEGLLGLVERAFQVRIWPPNLPLQSMITAGVCRKALLDVLPLTLNGLGEFCLVDVEIGLSPWRHEKAHAKRTFPPSRLLSPVPDFGRYRSRIVPTTPQVG
jgi:hypothetical protein